MLDLRMYHFKLSGKLWFNQILVGQISVHNYCQSSRFLSVLVNKQLRTELALQLLCKSLPKVVGGRVE